MALAGIAIGWLAAVALVRLLASLLYGVAPYDAATFTLTPVVILILAAISAYLPARRASRLDPAKTLHQD